MDSHIPEDALVSPPLHTTQDIPTTDPEEADAQAAAIDVPDDTGEGGKLRMIVQLVKRSFGVKDLAAMWASFSLSVECPLARVTRTALFGITHLRLSFCFCAGVSRYPRRCSSQYPTLNIGTTWTDPTFSSRTCRSPFPPLCCVPFTMIGNRINEHEDPLERMLAVLRFTFSKDIRHIVRLPFVPFPFLDDRPFTALFLCYF